MKDVSEVRPEGTLAEVEREKDRWEQTTVEKASKRQRERKPRFETTSGIPLERLYTPADVADQSYIEDLGFPGEYPFTRGVQPTMYRGRFWTMRQYAGYASAEESNQRYRYLLEHGTTGLSVAFDLPTQMGYDSDHPIARPEVGKVGVAISSLADMEVLLGGIPLDRVSTSMTINATAPILLALYVAAAHRQGVPNEKISGTVQNDILKEYIARGTYIYPPGPSMRLVADLIVYCSENLPAWNTISISGYHIREAGSTAVQEVAFTLADAIAYVQGVLDRGIPIDQFAPRLAFFFNAHNNFLEEVAKFRAARRLWARITRERFGARDVRSMMLRFHTQTAGSSLTAQQVENNIVRTALQALAAVMGGTQSLHTNSMDEAIALPTETAVRTALRTQQIIAYESEVADTIDPLAGSYAIEALTDEIERRALDYLKRIDEMGGTLKALENGFFQREIQDSAYRYQQEIDSRERIIVGVNEFVVPEAPPSNILRVDPEVQERQIRRVQELKQRRDNPRVQALLGELRAAAATDANLMPLIIACVEGYCTLGEISDVLREVFGEYRENLYV